MKPSKFVHFWQGFRARAMAGVRGYGGVVEGGIGWERVVRPATYVCFRSCFALSTSSTLVALDMSAAALNTSLEAMWLSAPPGRLSPWQQARALALREVSHPVLLHFNISSHDSWKL